MNKTKYVTLGVALFVALLAAMVMAVTDRKVASAPQEDSLGAGRHENEHHKDSASENKLAGSGGHNHGQRKLAVLEPEEHEPESVKIFERKHDAHAALPQKGDRHDHDADEHGSHGHGAEKDHGLKETADHGHSDGFAKGPHGGRLLKKGDFQIEIVGVESEGNLGFRVYAQDRGKPVDPQSVNLSMELRRLGNRVDHLSFKTDKDHLVSDQSAEQPHSFDVQVAADYRGKSFRWDYSQVEWRVCLGAEACKKAGIEVLNAGPERIRTEIELPGEVAFDADRVAHVVPRVTGVVAESRKNLGDPVKKGEVVAIIHSRELAEAKSRYLVYLRREELARTTFERSKSLWEKGVKPEQDYLNDKTALEEVRIELLAAAQKLMALGLSNPQVEKVASDRAEDLTRYEVASPFNGVVVNKHLSVGEWVSENSNVMVIADLSTVWVEIIVYVKDIPSLRIGQKAVVKSDASGLEATGEVSYIGPLVGEESRTARARVVLANNGTMWRPGLFVTVKLVDDAVTVPVAVRADAIQTLDKHHVLFVNYGDEFEARLLELGRKDRNYVEVKKGLSAGEKYAATNSFIVKAELNKGTATCGVGHSHDD